MSVVLSGVHIEFDGKRVLYNFSANLPDVGVVAVTGESGSGKTTLLRVLAGLIKPSEGSVVGLGEARAAFVFQEDRLLPWRTVAENIAIPARCKPEKVKTFLELTELWGDRNRYPHELSGGMQRRVALARALCFGGRVLLLDEPFKGLDAKLRCRITQRMRGLFPLTVIATHDPGEALSLANGEPFWIRL